MLLLRDRMERVVGQIKTYREIRRDFIENIAFPTKEEKYYPLFRLTAEVAALYEAAFITPQKPSVHESPPAPSSDRERYVFF
jgi:hypothetical protein